MESGRSHRRRNRTLANFKLSQAGDFLGKWSMGFRIVFVESRCIFWGFIHHRDVRHAFLPGQAASLQPPSMFVKSTPSHRIVRMKALCLPGKSSKGTLGAPITTSDFHCNASGSDTAPKCFQNYNLMVPADCEPTSASQLRRPVNHNGASHV